MKRKKIYLIIIVLVIVVLAIIILPKVIQNSGKDTHNNVIVDKEYLEMFNSKFLEHEGTGIKATDVRFLVTTVKGSNINEQTFKVSINQASVGGGVDADAGEQAFNDYMNRLNPSSLYTVHFLYDEKTGFINSVVITEDKSP
ncbi:MAG: hypothetical protein FWC53_00570 [Firmicutes bacterium]|nr:hypothetical protein [Bacillota bacterium]